MSVPSSEVRGACAATKAHRKRRGEAMLASVLVLCVEYHVCAAQRPLDPRRVRDRCVRCVPLRSSCRQAIASQRMSSSDWGRRRDERLRWRVYFDALLRPATLSFQFHLTPPKRPPTTLTHTPRILTSLVFSSLASKLESFLSQRMHINLEQVLQKGHKW
uniref:Secreted protein n=1 Tax=Parascaris univalens TaxID=6257 RepID=A0A915A6F9_PARUN